MLSKNEIEYVRSSCSALPPRRALAFSVAAAHRILPIYQVYGEARANVYGHGKTHDAVIAIWRLLRARPGATEADVTTKAAAAIGTANHDLELIQQREGFELPEELVTESITSVILALGAFTSSSPEDCFNASMSALEVDSVWGEENIEDVKASGAVPWEGLRSHYLQQVRDLEELSNADESSVNETYRNISTRAEREGMLYLTRMRTLLAEDLPS